MYNPYYIVTMHIIKSKNLGVGGGGGGGGGTQARGGYPSLYEMLSM